MTGAEARCWVEVDREALRSNFGAVRRLVGEKVGIIAVVKAEAYGHGAIETARLFESCGAAALGVTYLDEAERLRAAEISADILVFCPLRQTQRPRAIELAVQPTISSMDDATALSAAAVAAEKSVRVHLNVDCGMNRWGVPIAEVAAIARRVVELPGLILTGVYTHFPRAAESMADTVRRLRLFHRAVDDLRAAGIDPGCVHCANSAAAIAVPESHCDAVRVGNLLYGDWVAPQGAPRRDLRSAWSLKARVVAVRDLQRGETVGYGCEWQARRPSRVAVVSAGFADGVSMRPEARSPSLSRSLRSAARAVRDLVTGGDARGHVQIQGQPAPLVGRIAMQQCGVDVTDIFPRVECGAVVTLSARRTATGAHVPRLYVG